MQQLTQNNSVQEFFTWIPTKQNAIENNVVDNKPISEEGYMTRQDVVNLLIKYKKNPTAIQFIAEMIEE